MNPLRIVAFAEGSSGAPRNKRQGDPFETIWTEIVPTAASVAAFDRVVPINKKHLLAMDPDLPKMSSFNEPLDLKIARELENDPFDLAVIFWDLIPPWDSRPKCRWNETLKTYEGLSKSKALPQEWRERAARRYRELAEREHPTAKDGRQPVEAGETFVVCMEPMFESLLVQCEAVMLHIFEMEKRPRDWPKGWADPKVLKPDIDILQKVLVLAGRTKPRATVLSKVRGDMQTNKHGWGEHLLREMLSGEQNCRPKILAHPIIRRLSSILG